MKRYGFAESAPIETPHGPWVLYTEAQAHLTERDKLLEQCEATILEQQRVIKGLRDCVHMLDSQYLESGIYDIDLSALDAALKAERIKTLEDAEKLYSLDDTASDYFDKLHDMAWRLKEQSC